MQPRITLLINILRTNGITVTIYSGKRSLEEQKELLRKGWTTTLKSKHLTGDAVDLILKPNFTYKLAGHIWTLLEGKWGGNFKDPKLAAAEFQHFEKP